MHLILKFFVRKKPIEERLKRAISKIKGMDFILLSRLDGLPLVLVTKQEEYSNKRELAAMIAEAAAMSQKALRMFHNANLKSVFIEMERGALLVLLRPPIALSLLIPEMKIEKTNDIINKSLGIFDEVEDILE